MNRRSFLGAIADPIAVINGISPVVKKEPVWVDANEYEKTNKLELLGGEIGSYKNITFLRGRKK